MVWPSVRLSVGLRVCVCMPARTCVCRSALHGVAALLIADSFHVRTDGLTRSSDRGRATVTARALYESPTIAEQNSALGRFQETGEMPLVCTNSAVCGLEA